MFPPGLSMLWESTEPGAALRERFGFDSFDEAASWLLKGLADVWAIDAESCERIVISGGNAIAWVRTDRGPLVVKWSRVEPLFERLSAVADLLHALDRQGVPVAAPVSSIDGRHRVTIDDFSIMVQPRIDGDLLDVTDETAVRAAGASLARLHGVLATHKDHRLITSGSLDFAQQIGTWLDHGDKGTAPEASARLRDQLAALPPIDGEPQLIHGDYRASNVLMAGSQVVAVIDFDEVRWDYRIGDLANAFVYLGTHFRDWRPTAARVRAALLDGYESVRPLSGPEHQWLRALALWRGILAVPAGDDPAGWAKAL